MSELIEDYEEPKVRSIASEEYEFLLNEQPPIVTYQNVTGYLLRHRCESRYELMALTMDEFNECIELNRPVDEKLI